MTTQPDTQVLAASTISGSAADPVALAEPSAPDSVADPQVLAALDAAERNAIRAVEAAFALARGSLSIPEDSDAPDLLDTTAANISPLGLALLTWARWAAQSLDSDGVTTPANVACRLDALTDQLTTLRRAVVADKLQPRTAPQSGTHFPPADQLVAAIGAAAGLLDHARVTLPASQHSPQDGARMATEMRTTANALAALSKALHEWAIDVACRHDCPRSAANEAADEFRRFGFQAGMLARGLDKAIEALNGLPADVTA